MDGMNALIMWIGMSLLLFLALPFIIRLLVWAAKKWLAAWESILYMGRSGSSGKESKHGTEKSMGSGTLD